MVSINEAFRCKEPYTAGQRYSGSPILAYTLERCHCNVLKAHSPLCNLIHLSKRLFCFQTLTRQPPEHMTLAWAAARVQGAAGDPQEHKHSPGGSTQHGKRSSGRQIMPSYLEISCNGMISCLRRSYTKTAKNACRCASQSARQTRSVILFHAAMLQQGYLGDKQFGS
jgi:hypothetical protein